eukprot:7647433-Alexandrium_andersonii.AAC.1
MALDTSAPPGPGDLGAAELPAGPNGNVLRLRVLDGDRTPDRRGLAPGGPRAAARLLREGRCHGTLGAPGPLALARQAAGHLAGHRGV